MKKLNLRIPALLCEQQLFGGGHGKLLNFLLALGKELIMLPLGSHMGIGHQLVCLGLCILPLFLTVLIQLLLRILALLLELGFQILKLGFIVLLVFLCLSTICLGIIMLLPVVSLTLFHELLYRLVEQQIQATAQNRKVQEVQQDLLKVDIKWNIHGWHLPL